MKEDMKKFVKWSLIALGCLTGVILLDTVQAKVLNTSPFLKIRKTLTSSDSTYYIDRGILLNHYSCKNNEEKTLFKTAKYSCPISDDETTIKRYSKTIDKTRIQLDILNNWNYEELITSDESRYLFALKIYKDSEDRSAILYFYKEPFAICGTGLTSENLQLNNGRTASVGYYKNEQNTWNFVSFPNLDSRLAFINNMDDERDALEMMEIVKTLNIA